MHDIDQTTDQMVRSVLAYAENRLRMDPVPLDIGTLPADQLYARLAGLIRDSARHPDEVLGVYSSVIAPSIISADSTRFLGLHPGRADQGQPAVRHARVLRVDPGHLVARGVGRDRGREHRAAADLRRGRAAGERRRLLRLRAGPRATSPRWPWRARPRRSGSATPGKGRRLRVVVSTDAHSSIVNTLRLLEMDALEVETPDHRLTGEAVRGGDRGRPRRLRRGSRRVHVRHHQRRHRRRPRGRRRRGQGARLVVPRRRGVRRVRASSPTPSSPSTPASSWPTPSSSTRTSGCSRRSTAVP